jgi:hypothetical protein
MAEVYNELRDWAEKELATGSRIKASRINKVAGRVFERKVDYWEAHIGEDPQAPRPGSLRRLRREGLG